MKAQELHRRFVHVIQGLTRTTSHLLWPGQCLVCDNSIHPADEGLCIDCWQQLSASVAADYCRRCGRDVSPYGIVDGNCGGCRDEQYHYDGIVRVGVYEATLRSLILAFKFNEKTELAPRLAQMLKQTLTVSHINQSADVIVPVPLHWRRKIKRGYNQAHLLARHIKDSEKRLSTDLVRVRNTEQQWDLTPAQRRRNVKGAFAVRRGHPFAERTVLLVDDITTSGATLNECAKALKAAGAKTVFAAVLATAFHD